jgi:hypothetical protein
MKSAQVRWYERHPEERGKWARQHPIRNRRNNRRWRGMPEPTHPKPRRCELCGGTPKTGRWKILHLDHDHETGTFRGWLCHNCNVGLGHFDDSVPLLRKAIAYLANGDYNVLT